MPRPSSRCSPRSPGSPGSRDGHTPLVVGLDSPNSPAAEGYRSLRTAIEFLALNRPLGSVQVTSPQTDEGKSTTIANLAVAFARRAQRDRGQLRSAPAPHPRVLRAPQRRGAHLVAHRRGVGIRGPPAGPRGGQPRSARRQGRPRRTRRSCCRRRGAREVLASVKEGCDFVLVDSPPVMPLSDALVVSGMVDGTLLVVSAEGVVAAGAAPLGRRAPSGRRPARGHRAQQLRDTRAVRRLRLVPHSRRRQRRERERRIAPPEAQSEPRGSVAFIAPLARRSRPPRPRVQRRVRVHDPSERKPASLSALPDLPLTCCRRRSRR